MQKPASRTRARAFYIWLMAPLCGAVSILAVFLSLAAPAATAAATSSNLNFQARILGSSGTVVPDGNYNIDFKIYNADSTTGSVGTCSGACLWEETRKNSNSQGVQVINGYFSVNLGSVTSFPAINWDQQLWLTMNIGGTSGGASPTWDGEMQNSGHSIALTALPYSFVAGQLALTSGAHRGVLSFNTVANDPNITLPDATGTVCLQAASACGFEATSGTDFIRNQTSVQTANYNIQSAASGSIGAIIQGASGQSVDILQVKTNTPVTVFSVGATGSLLSKTTTSSLTAFQVQNSSNTALLTADTTNLRLGVDVSYSQMSAPSGFSATACSSSCPSGNLTNGTTYYYKVTAIDSAGGETTPSSEASAAATATHVMNLSWNQVTGASGYRVYRGTVTNTENVFYDILGTVSSGTVSYQDTNPPNGSNSGSPPSSNTAYTSTNNSNNLNQLSIGGNGTPTGQVYVGGVMPSSPIGALKIGNFDLPYAVAVQGRYAYLATETGTFFVVDVSNPASPKTVGSTSNGAGPGGQSVTISVQGRYAYVTSFSPESLIVFDISKPSNPVRLSYINTLSSGSYPSVYIQGRYAYMVNNNFGAYMQVIDISNPASLKLVSSVNAVSNPNSIYVSGRYAYIAGDGGLQIVDISNPLNPTSLGNTYFGAGSDAYWSVYVVGRYAYLTDYGLSLLRIIDVSNPSSPVQVSSLASANSGPRPIYVQDRYAYVIDYNGGNTVLQSFDISNPTQPFSIGTVSLGSSSYGRNLTVVGRYLYVAASDSTDLKIFDMGGVYTQQLEAGGAQFGTLSVDSNAVFAGDASVQGGLSVGSLQAAGNVGIAGGSNIIGSAILSGGNNSLGAPGAPTVTPQGTAGSTNYSYKITAINASGGETSASAAGSTSTGNASLSGSNFNRVTWSAVTAASGYKVYRTVGGSTTGYLASSTSTTFDDNGNYIGDSSTAPTIDTTGQLTVEGSSLFQPASSLVAGQSNITQIITNASSTGGGVVNGYSQTITVSDTLGGDTNGFNIAINDNSSLTNNITTGIKINLAGSNTDQNDYGVAAAVANGVGLKGSSADFSVNGFTACGVRGVSYAIGVCGENTANSNHGGVGVYGSSVGYEGSLGITFDDAAGVVGYNGGTGTAAKFFTGVKGISVQSTAAAYTTIGVYGVGKGGAGATNYGGYFMLGTSAATAGAALYASNSTIAANILQLQDNTGSATDVFVVGDGGLVTSSTNSASGLIVQDSSSSKAVLTVDTSGDQVLLGKAGASGLTGKLTFNNASGSHTVSFVGPSTDPTSSFSLTLPSALPGSTQCLQSDNAGALSFTACVSGTAVTTIGTYASTNHYANGAQISGSTLTLGSADSSNPGLIDTSSQTFAGNKTFTGSTLVQTTSNSVTAFQIQDSTALDLFNVNTTDGYVIDNGAAAIGNQVQNPSFESSGTTESTGWYTPSASQVITNSSANAHGGNYELQVSGNSSTHAVMTKYFAVHPGDTVYAEAYVKNSAGANGDGGIYLEFSDKDKGNATYSNADTGLPGTSYIAKIITTTVPANKYFVRIAASVKATATAGTFYFDDFYLKKVNEQAPLLLTNVSATAFQVLNSSSLAVLGVDTSSSKIFSTLADGGSAIGFTLNTPSYSTSGAKLLSVQNNAAEKFSVDKDGNVNIASGAKYKINGSQISSADLSNNTDLAKLSGTGPQIFSGNNEFDGTVLNKVASATAFQVQNASNTVFTVDTSGNKVILGTASNITGKIQFQGSGGAGTLTLAGPATPDTGNFTLTIPAITANANVCTDNTICSGYASSSSLTTGLAGKLNKGSVDTSAAAVTAVQGNLYAFTNSSSGIASGVLKLDNGSNTDNALYVTGTTDYASGKAYIVVNNTNGTPTGNLIDLQSNAVDEFTVDASGNVTAAGNISIASGKVYQINGVQITSAALSDGNTLAKLGSNQTFTGNNTFSSASNSFTGDGSGLTNLNATNVASGTLNDGRLSSNVALLNRAAQSFTGDNTFAPTANNVGTTVKQTSGTATSGSVLDVQTADGLSHFLQITNAAANEGNVTLQSVGATRDLTLGSGSGTLKIAAATGTIQHSNTTLTIDVNSGSNSTLTITNAGAGLASLDVEGSINVGGSQVYKVNGTSGTGSTCSSNTFSQNQVVNGGITTSNTCANAVTTIGAAGGSIANGASISGNTLTLGYADTSNPGLVSNTTQSFNGAKTFTNDLIAKSNSATAFQVQNTSVRSLFNVDTSGNVVTIGNTTDGAQITLGATGNANGTIRKTMIVTGSISANDLVEIDTTNAGQVQQASASSTKVFGVATSAVGSGSSQDIVIAGIYQVNANASGGTIAIGDTLVSSSTAGQATKSGSTTASGSVIGLALSTLSGGKVWVYMNLGLGGSDNLQTVYNKSTGGTTPELKVDSTRGALDIQDADSALNASLLTVRNGNSGGLGAAILDVQSANPITDITNNTVNNLVSNASFETGTTGWAAVGSSTLSQSTNMRYVGSNSLQIATTTTAGGDGAKFNLTTTTLASNTQYSLNLYARTDFGTTMSTFQIGRAEDGSTNSSCATGQSVTGSGWTQISCTFTTSTTSGTPYIYAKQTDTTARNIFIDAVTLNRVSILSNANAEQTFAAGDWQAKGSATVTRDTTQFNDGAASVKIVTSSGASNNDGVKHNQTLNDSTQYYVSFYAKLDSGSTALTTMEAGYSSDGSTDNTACITGQTVVSTGWTNYTCRITTPSSHSGTPFFYIKELNTTGPKTFYVDSVVMTIGNPLSAYREGQIALNGVINSPVALQAQSNSNTAFQVQNSAGANILVVDSTNRQLKVYENNGSTNYALIYYDTTSSTANYTASSGTVAVGAGAGAITITAGSGAAVNITGNAASTWKTNTGTLTLQSGATSDLILNPGSSIVSVNGSSVVKLGSSAGDPGTCTVGAIVYNSTTNVFRGCQGSSPAWATLSSTTQTLQQAYTASTGSTTPEIKVDSTRNGVDIQDADTTIGGVLFAVRATNAGGLGTSLFNVTSSNNTVNIGASGTSTALLVLGSDTNSTFNAGTITNAATQVNGAMFYSSTDHNFLCGVAGAWVTCNGLLYSNTSAPSAVNTCTTACAAFTTSAPIPANYCQAGRVIHIIARGVYGLQNVASQTYALGVYYGTDGTTKTNDVLLGTSTSTTSQTNLTNNGWKLDTTIICYDTTHMQTEGDFTYAISNTAATAAQTVLQTDTATTGTTVTSTSAKNIYLFPAYGASNSANTATLQQLIVTGN